MNLSPKMTRTLTQLHQVRQTHQMVVQLSHTLTSVNYLTTLNFENHAWKWWMTNGMMCTNKDFF